MKKINTEEFQRVLEENKSYYNSEYAAQYDDIHPIQYNHYSQKIMRKEIGMILSQLRKETISVLDVGSGTGTLSVNICHQTVKNLHITAVDIAERMLHQLRKKITAQFGQIQLQAVASDIDSFLNQNDKHYDIVGFASAIHHFPDYLTVVGKCADAVADQGFLYIHQEPLDQRNVNAMGRLINYIDTRTYFCFHVFKKEGMPFYIRWIKYFKALISPLIQRSGLIRSVTQRLAKSPRFQWLYNDGSYSDDRMRYVEYHEEGLDRERIVDALLLKGFAVQCVNNAPDKHYRLFFWLSRWCRAASHFSLIAKKSNNHEGVS